MYNLMCICVFIAVLLNFAAVI